MVDKKRGGLLESVGRKGGTFQMGERKDLETGGKGSIM